MKKLLLLCFAVFFTAASYAGHMYIMCIAGQTYWVAEVNGQFYMSSPGPSCPYFHPTVMGTIVPLPESPSGTGSEFDMNTERMLNENFDPEQMNTPTNEERTKIETALAGAENMPTTYVYYHRLDADVQAYFDSLR